MNLGRITGLDPAGPLYRLAGADDRLASTDADLVVALHTDGGVAGYWRAIGDVDFYANGGFPQQPGCTDLLSEFVLEFFVVAVINFIFQLLAAMKDQRYYLLNQCTIQTVSLQRNVIVICIIC